MSVRPGMWYHIVPCSLKILPPLIYPMSSRAPRLCALTNKVFVSTPSESKKAPRNGMSRARQRADDRTFSGLDSVSMGAEHIQTPDGAPVNGRSNVLMDGTHPFHVLGFERIFSA